MLKHSVGPTIGALARRRSAWLALVGLVGVLALPAGASADSGFRYFGRAYNVKATVLGSIHVSIGTDTGEISTTSDTPNTTSLNAGSLTSPFGFGSVFNSSVKTGNGQTESDASIAKLTLTLPGLPIIKGSVLKAESQTQCVGGAPFSGGSSIGTLSIGTRSYSLAAPPNTTINLSPVAKIVINQQYPVDDGLVVNAVAVYSPLATAVVDSAKSGVEFCGV